MTGFLITKVNKDQIITLHMGNTVVYLAVEQGGSKEVIVKIKAPKDVIITKPKAN